MPDPQTYNEAELLLKIAEGDEEAFSVLFKKYAPLLEDNIRRMVKDPFATDEVLQECFIKIWVNRDKLAGVTYLRAYLQKLSLNESFNYLNKLALQKKLSQLAGNSGSLLTGHPEETLAYKETLAIIQDAINTLPGQRKTIYELSRNQGLNSVEIADALHLTPDYVRKAISAARKHIKDHLLKAGKLLATFSGVF